MCEHKPNQITFYPGRAFPDLSGGGGAMTTENLYICECGEWFTEDPNEEPIENLRRELTSEWTR
jgi:hypothetical protein